MFLRQDSFFSAYVPGLPFRSPAEGLVVEICCCLCLLKSYESAPGSPTSFGFLFFIQIMSPGVGLAVAARAHSLIKLCLHY
jgi:hypothetical protein